MAPAGTSAGASTTRPIASHDGQQDAAEEKRARHQHAVVGADARAHQVRHDEADEADRTGQRDRRRPSAPSRRRSRIAETPATSAPACRGPRLADRQQVPLARLTRRSARRATTTTAMNASERPVVDRVEAADQPARDRKRLRHARQPVDQQDQRRARRCWSATPASSRPNDETSPLPGRRAHDERRGRPPRRRARRPDAGDAGRPCASRARWRPPRRATRRPRRRACTASPARRAASPETALPAERQRAAGEQTEQRARQAQLDEDRPVRLLALPARGASRARRADERQHERRDARTHGDDRDPPAARARQLAPSPVARPTPGRPRRRRVEPRREQRRASSDRRRRGSSVGTSRATRRIREHDDAACRTSAPG